MTKPSSEIRIGISPTLTAFDSRTIGSKVLDPAPFLGMVEDQIRADIGREDAPGQFMIPMPADACALVSAGIGERSTDPEAYVVRLHRGRVDAFLRREHAAPVESCAVIVYTRAAFVADPQVTGKMIEQMDQEDHDEEDWNALPCTHVLVAVLAGAGPSELSPYRLVANLAGGNNAVKGWTMDDVHARACASIEYDAAWCAVAD